MAGLDKIVLNSINPGLTIDHIKTDIRTDFALAPHFNAIFNSNSNELWRKTSELLKSGNYVPNLPYTFNVPKEGGFTRPGSILSPIDRFIYQALIDNVLPILEEQLDRKRTFSNVLVTDRQGIFKPAHDSWKSFQDRITELCQLEGFILKADIANYFERIPQHHLINLMSAAGCQPEIVKLLEEMLLAFQERNSFGIIQGLFPSDILGNFFLSDFDAYCELNDIPSARYVDDIYMYFQTEPAARKGLIDLIERLRKNGLHLNELKSGIRTTKDIIREETEIDELFEQARDTIQDELDELESMGYGFAATWESSENIDSEDSEINLAAVEKLYGAIEDFPAQADKIEKFCLPILRSAGSNAAVDYVVENLLSKPHLTRLHHSYLSRFVSGDKNLQNSLESFMKSENLITGYEKMYILGSLFKGKNIQRDNVNLAIRWLKDTTIEEETRAMAAIFAAKHGIATQKREVRLSYENEPSEYVRSAILYSARFLTTPEKRTCKKAWGGHSFVNTLIAHSI